MAVQLTHTGITGIHVDLEVEEGHSKACYRTGLKQLYDQLTPTMIIRSCVKLQSVVHRRGENTRSLRWLVDVTFSVLYLERQLTYFLSKASKQPLTLQKNSGDVTIAGGIKKVKSHQCGVAHG